MKSISKRVIIVFSVLFIVMFVDAVISFRTIQMIAENEKQVVQAQDNLTFAQATENYNRSLALSLLATSASTILNLLLLVGAYYLSNLDSYQKHQLIHAQAEQKRLTEQISNILESITDPFFATDKKFRFTYINTPAAIAINSKKENIIGKNLWDEFPSFKYTHFYNACIQAMEEQQPVKLEDYYEPLKKWFVVHAYPSKNGLAIYFDDITDEKHAQEKVAQLAAIVKYSDDAIIGKTLDGHITTWNSGAERIYGYKAKEIIGKSISVLTPPDKREELEHILNYLKKGKRVDHFETERITKDGKRIDVLVSISPIKNAEGKVIGASSINADITQEKQVQEELRRSKEQLEIIFQNIADGVTVQDQNGKLIFANKAAAEALGFTTGEELLHAYHTKPKTLAKRFEMKDEQGNPFKSEDLPGRRALLGEKNPEAIVHYTDKWSEKTRWSLIKARPIYDEDGNIQYTVNIIIDITEAKELEQRKDEFISIASHELKTPLTTIKAYTQILEQRLQASGDSQATSYVAKMDAYIHKLTGLIGDLLDVSKVQAGKLQLNKETIHFDELVKESISDIQPTTKTHEIILKGETKTTLYGDSIRIEQVINNLLTNAIKYSPKADKVIVEISATTKEVKCSVQDFGMGIPKEKQEKIFEKFYRAEEVSRGFSGLGIGLYISSEIITRHHGKLWVESKKGKGSTFFFTLPITQEQKEKTKLKHA